MPLNPQQTIQRILKVDHAGEYGAIRIYRAQLWIARWRHAGLITFLQETLTHEIEHCRIFRAFMPQYKTRPCRTMFLWSLGGYMLGLFTGLLGKNAIMLCTKAVERTVHRHMQEQVEYLALYDAKLRDAVEKIQTQELEHLHFAEARCKDKNVFANALNMLVVVVTEIVIWLSTWGDVSRMRKELLSR